MSADSEQRSDEIISSWNWKQRTGFLLALVLAGLAFAVFYHGQTSIPGLTRIPLTPSQWKSQRHHNRSENQTVLNNAMPNDVLFISHKFKGRIGNEMFQYSALYAIAMRNNMSAILPRSLTLSFQKGFKNLTIPKGDVPGKKSWYALEVPDPMMYHKSVMRLRQLGENILLRGYFSSWKYFDNVHDDIRKQFSFREEYVTKTQTFIRNHITAALSTTPDLNDPRTFIGVHIRRGDVLSKAVQNKGYVLSERQYFDQAMRYYEEKFNNTVFIVCSDDKKWAAQNIKSSQSLVVYSTFNDALHDMCLLTQCNHSIISVGTFGWWTGWLAGGEVIYDKRFPKQGSGMWKGYRKKDYYPETWIGL